jgi:hypothetical protein
MAELPEPAVTRLQNRRGVTSRLDVAVVLVLLALRLSAKARQLRCRHSGPGQTRA